MKVRQHLRVPCPAAARGGLQGLRPGRRMLCAGAVAAAAASTTASLELGCLHDRGHREIASVLSHASVSFQLSLDRLLRRGFLERLGSREDGHVLLRLLRLRSNTHYLCNTAIINREKSRA